MCCHPTGCEVHHVACPPQPGVGCSDSSSSLLTSRCEFVADLLEVAVVIHEVGVVHPLAMAFDHDRGTKVVIAASGGAARYSARCNDVLFECVTPSNKM